MCADVYRIEKKPKTLHNVNKNIKKTLVVDTVF